MKPHIETSCREAYILQKSYQACGPSRERPQKVLNGDRECQLHDVTPKKILQLMQIVVDQNLINHQINEAQRAPKIHSERRGQNAKKPRREAKKEMIPKKKELNI